MTDIFRAIPDHYNSRLSVDIHGINKCTRTMAEYITADRWLTGIDTHKTKRGRILCTGMGCLGCFPDDYPELARELEVYDSKTALLYGENLNDLSNEEPTETESNQSVRSSTKRKHFVIANKNEKATESKEQVSSSEGNTDTVNTDAITSERNEENEKVFLTEYIQETETRGKHKISQSENTARGPPEVESCRGDSDKKQNLPSKDSSTDQSRVILDDGGIVDREDCVCLFFALEYNRSARTLPGLSILEIVESLNTLMHINKIKCVQRLNGKWHILLRTREHLSHLLINGMTIRGRWYQMVQDNNMYCDKVY